MKLTERYKKTFAGGKPVVSFEIFPPKTAGGEQKLMEELRKLACFDPGFISVTYGAGGSTRDKTLEIALRLRDEIGLTPLVHFTCVGANRDEIQDYLRIVRENKIENILALRGDPPQGETSFTPPQDGFAHASDMVAYIRRQSGLADFMVAVAGYPEGHLEAPDLDTDIEFLKKKADAGADVIITQLFYDNTDFYRFLDKIERAGITLPVIPGIMPVTSPAQVAKISTMCGARIPAELLGVMNGCDSSEEICRHGIEYSIRQVSELVSRGIGGIHFFTLNKAAAVGEIITALGIAN